MIEAQQALLQARSQITELTERLTITVLPTRKPEEDPRSHNPQSETTLALSGLRFD
jgi:hypothetical protein